MKKSRIFLTITMLALVILVFTGCQGVVPTPSPGVTEDVTVISGRIKMPLTCCAPEGVYTESSDKDCDEAELWPFVPNAVVELKSAAKGKCKTVLATTLTDEDGNYLFEDVKPGLYIITAFCPEETKTSFFLKDVAEKIHGVALDAGIPDCTSTSLALVIEKVNNCYNDWYHCYNKLNTKVYKLIETIAKDVGKVDIVAIMNHNSFGDYCDDIYDDLVDLICDFGCCTSPGTTGGGGGPTPGPTNYTLTLLVEPEGAGTATQSGSGTYPAGTTVDILAVANPCYEFGEWEINSGDPGEDFDSNLNNTEVLMNGNVTLTAHFCPTIVGVEINFKKPNGEQYVSESALKTIAPPDLKLCLDQCATITSVSIKFECDNLNVDLGLDDENLEWDYDNTDINFVLETGAFCLNKGSEPGRYFLKVTYTDPCGGDEWYDSLAVEFEDCEPIFELIMAVSPEGSGTTDPTIGGPYYYPEGEEIDISAVELGNYQFLGWASTAGTVTDISNKNTTFTMPAQNVTVTAIFRLEDFFDGGNVTVGFEDLPSESSSDFDYNDFVLDITTSLTKIIEGDDDGKLKEIKFTFIPKARGAGNNGSFWLNIPKNTFQLSGGNTASYVLSITGSSYSTGSSGNYDPNNDDLDLRVIPWTREAL
ncbi:MAG: hypothetical protein GX294_00395, partial [Candidatus Cloacimonetes bacterium]|nr:hypothetical protein [Candidatus Cloacimonadota bacterium]